MSARVRAMVMKRADKAVRAPYLDAAGDELLTADEKSERTV